MRTVTSSVKLDLEKRIAATTGSSSIAIEAIQRQIDTRAVRNARRIIDTVDKRRPMNSLGADWAHPQVKLEASARLDGILTRTAAVPDALFGLQFEDESESYFVLELYKKSCLSSQGGSSDLGPSHEERS